MDLKDENGLILLFLVILAGLGIGIAQFFKRKDK